MIALLLKSSVKLLGIRPEIVLAIQVTFSIYAQLGATECVITSVTDGQHQVGSAHYDGSAFDVRTKNVGIPAQAIQEALRVALGSDYDVPLEGLGMMNEHIHVEFDPKG